MARLSTSTETCALSTLHVWRLSPVMYPHHGRRVWHVHTHALPISLLSLLLSLLVPSPATPYGVSPSWDLWDPHLMTSGY